MDIKIKNQDKLKEDQSELMNMTAEDPKEVLRRAEEIAEGYFLESDKVNLFKDVGEKLLAENAVDEAISCYYNIFKLNVAYVEEIRKLVRLCYEQKKNLKIALRIISECLDNSPSDEITIQYLCEWLRAIRSLPNVSYAKVEELIYERLAEFSTGDREAVLKNGVALISGMMDFVDSKDYVCIHRLNVVLEGYQIAHPSIVSARNAIIQLIECMEQDKVHEVIPLYIAENTTEENETRVEEMLLSDGKAILESLLYLKENAPLYWQKEKKLSELEARLNS